MAENWQQGKARLSTVPEPDGLRTINPLEPVSAAAGEWMSRLLLNLDKRVRLLEGSAGREPGTDADAVGECLLPMSARGTWRAASSKASG